MSAKLCSADGVVTIHLRLRFEGLVQGVGFRPFIDRLANSLQLTGWVANTANGVTAQIQGDASCVESFMKRVLGELPVPARIDRIHRDQLAPSEFTGFEIRPTLRGAPSDTESPALPLPDLATCPQCLHDVLNPANRRYRYPFTSCTQCGPRYSVMLGLPYDRVNTTMREFTMCSVCRTEYECRHDRRYHAQPNACPDCGPQLALWDAYGAALSVKHEALRAAAQALRDGLIVALKGVGGFQLLVDARNETAVARLRDRKRRPEKPFAVMARDLPMVEQFCHTPPLAIERLSSAAAPIVLLRRRALPQTLLAASIAPSNPEIGFMLPASALHHLLMHELGFVVVATSGNLSGEPLATDNRQALEQLDGIADYFLVHDRPIAAPIDDSVLRIVAGRALVLRCARGYAPLSMPVETSDRPLTILAFGGHQKATTAVSVNGHALVGPHIGDLDSARSRQAFDEQLARLVHLRPNHVTSLACDQHPDYYSTRAARNHAGERLAVQHHIAHIAACIADNRITGPVLGVAWDGNGYGEDGSLWGGEFIVVDGVNTQRVASLRPFPLPGGEIAVSEPRRSAIGLLYEMGGDTRLDDENLAPVASFSRTERQLLRQMLNAGVNSPRTSSVGRLFDAVAALLDLKQITNFQGQAAMALEFAAESAESADQSDKVWRYALPVTCHGPGKPLTLNWANVVQAVIDDIGAGVGRPLIAAAFHRALANAIVAVARRQQQSQIVLTGGCFQNRVLTEMAIERLRAAGFTPYWHRDLPPNDGALALGQAVWTTRLAEREKV